MKNELDAKSKFRLYGLTSMVCSFWLIQTVCETIQMGKNLLTVLNLIFYSSLIIVIFYTAYSSFGEYKKSRENSKS